MSRFQFIHWQDQDRIANHKCFNEVMRSAAQRLALQLPPRRAPRDSFKKGTISRAEGGQLQAPVGPPAGF